MKEFQHAPVGARRDVAHQAGRRHGRREIGERMRERGPVRRGPGGLSTDGLTAGQEQEGRFWRKPQRLDRRERIVGRRRHIVQGFGVAQIRPAPGFLALRGKDGLHQAACLS